MKSEGKEMQRASRAKAARGAGPVIDCKGRTRGFQRDLTDASPYQTSWRTASQPARPGHFFGHGSFPAFFVLL